MDTEKPKFLAGDVAEHRTLGMVTIAGRLPTEWCDETVYAGRRNPAREGDAILFLRERDLSAADKFAWAEDDVTVYSPADGIDFYRYLSAPLKWRSKKTRTMFKASPYPSGFSEEEPSCTLLEGVE